MGAAVYHRATLAILSIMTLAGCGTEGGPGPAEQTSYDYQGTASVGDFVTITVDHVAQTIDYTNLTNGNSGSATFTLDADGAYLISDPDGSLITAYEIPGYALVVQAEHTGPGADTPSLIVAILKSPLHTSDIAGGGYNFMQFRTNSGGMEIGHVAIDPLGTITTQGYWPYGSASGQSSFNGGSFDASLMQADPTDNFLLLQEPEEDRPTYIFGTQGGFLAVDTPNGGIVCLHQSSSKDFDPAWAGTYRAIVYQKENAQTGEGNQESGDISLIRGTITVGAAGQVTAANAEGEEVVNTTLVPVEDDPDLYGAGKFEGSCDGLFTFSLDEGAQHREVFFVFLDDAILFSSFAHEEGNYVYNYFYGAALKQ